MRKKQMVSVFPIRYIDGRREHLLIKRATIAYNWQCVTGGVKEEEEPLDAAHRELFEETRYRVEKMIPYVYDEDFFIDDELYGKRDDELLKQFLDKTEGIVFIALIEERQDPVLDPEEHTDWEWCNYETAYDKILWAIEKKQLRIVSAYLDS